MLSAEDRGLTHEDRCAPLADPTRGEGPKGVRHLVDQRLRQAEVSRPLGGGVSACQGHLAGDAEALLLRRDTLGGLLLPL